MAIVERLLPRYWDGRRLLRFLAGLALLALAFAVPAVAVTDPAPATVSIAQVTTVDAAATVSIAQVTTVDAAATVSIAQVTTVDAAAVAAVVPVAQVDRATTTALSPVTAPRSVVFVPIAAPIEPTTFAEGECQHAWGSRGPPLA